MTLRNVFKTFLLATFVFDTVAWFELVVGLQLMYPSKIHTHDSIITTKHFVFVRYKRKESVILMF